jgi:hypothetical protein
MLGLALLVAFAPAHAFAPAQGSTPAQDAARPGELAPHLATTPSRQWRLSTNPGWRDFRATWGGQWFARWDERNGTPRFLAAPGVPEHEAPALVDDISQMAGVDPAEWQPTRTTKTGNRTLRQWTRTWEGAPVIGDQILTVAIDGRIAGVWVQITPIGHLPSPQPGEQVLPLPRFPSGQDWAAPSNGVRPTLVTLDADGPLIRYRDRAGVAVHTRDTRHFDNVQVTYQERTVGDRMVTDPARGVTVSTDGSTDVTDANGDHSLSGALALALDGPDLTVSANGTLVEANGSGDVTLYGGSNIPLSAATTLWHFHVVWDWLALRWPSHSWLGSNVPANVDITSGACNAYYTGGTINFLQGASGSCNNFGQVADVLYHEVGHGIHHYILAGGTFASDISEGSADFVSATINDDPEVGPNSRWDGGYVREIRTDRVFPDDVSGEVHNDGLIWASFLWDLREQWTGDQGDEAGAEATDTLFLGALQQGPTLTDAYEAVILADDDDGDLSNSTPHACELVDLLMEHGLGPGPIGMVQFDHTALGPQTSGEEGYFVSFDLSNATASCGDLDPDSVALWVTTDPSDVPTDRRNPEEPGGDTGDTGAPSDPYETWTQVDLSREGDTWSGTIDRVPADTRVWYFMEAASGSGDQIVMTHGGDFDRLYSFTVGDRETLWCADFEDGAPDFLHGSGLSPDSPGAPEDVDGWEIGAPDMTRFGPGEATSGTEIAATNLVGDYAPNSRQYLQSPVVSIGDDPGRMLMLSYQRFLTVEDGLYDRAVLRTEKAVLYKNPETESGSEHVLDTEWTLQDLDLEEHLEEGGDVQFTWTLKSDQGLEFGGWAMDDVCVVRLDDEPAHYRRAGLNATDDQDAVTVTWTQPWILPMTASVLVRKVDGWPEDIDDGVILDLDVSPEPGEVREIVDTDASEGETFHYALFIAGEDDETWFTEIEEGVNADMGGVPEPADPLDTGTDDDDTGEDPGDDGDPAAAGPKERGGCGCASTTLGGGAWLSLLALLAVARRRSER